VQKNPELAIAHYYLGRINLELKNYEEAEKAYYQALRLNEKMEPALFDLGSFYQMSRKYERQPKPMRSC
jgi:tetratricopeptide (TPR) repeat protein